MTSFITSTTLFIAIITIASITHAFHDFPRIPKHRIPKSHPEFTLSNDAINASVNFGLMVSAKQVRHDQRISESPVRVRTNEISYGQWIDGLPSNISIAQNRVAQTILKAAANLMDTKCTNENINDAACMDLIRGTALPDCNLLEECQEVRRKSKFVPFRRLIQADYKDSMYKIRRSRGNGHKSLPMPRNITSQIFTSNMANLLHSPHDFNIEGFLDKKRNILLPAFTQFIEQDLSRPVVQTFGDGGKIECCTDTFHLAPPRYRHDACMPLEIIENDPYYSSKYITCLNYVRSSLASSNCEFGPAQQINEASYLLDLSQLYGSTREATNDLREFSGGRLKSGGTDSMPTLQLHDDEMRYCMHKPNGTGVCYKSGDVRVNVHPFVTILHTIFMHSHNSIAAAMQQAKPDWGDEYLFKQARLQNKALYQKIVYGEWADIVLGTAAASAIRSEAVKNVEPGVSNEFAVAAIKFYNSMMPGDLETVAYQLQHHQNAVNSTLHGDEMLKLQDVFYRPINLAASNNTDKILQALLHQKAMAMDSGVVDDLSTELYSCQHPGFDVFGTDSLALDIMRGRDHGVTGYHKYASHCLGKNIRTWHDLIGVTRSVDLELIKRVYGSVKDVDLIVGLISEIPLEGATVGPTTVCIIGEQLANTRSTDLEMYDRILAHPLAQKSMAQLLCETTHLPQVPKNAFLRHSNENELIDCNQFRNGN